MTLKSQAAAGVKWTSISALVIAVTEVVRTIVLARFLSPADFGLMAMVMVVIGFAQMYIDMGISAAVIHRQDAVKEQLSSLYWLNILSGLTVFALVWILAPLITQLFREPRLLPLLKVVAFVFIIIPIGSQFEILLQKELSFKVLATQDIVASLGATAIAILCAISGRGVWTLVYTFLASVALKTSLLCRIGFFRFRPSFHFRRPDLKGYIGFGLFQIGERSLNYLGSRLDQILIGSSLGSRALGFYSFAFNLAAQPIWRINPIITKVAFPVFSKVQHDPKKLKNGYTELLSFLTTINAPLLIGFAAVAPLAVPLIFGRKWSESITLVRLLCLITLSRSTSNPVGSLQLAKGRADLGFKWTVGFLLVSIPAICAGAKIGGATGVAVALLLLQMCLQVPAYLCLVRPLIGRCGQQYSSAILKPIALALAMGFMVASLPLLLRGFSKIVLLTLQLAVGMTTYMALLRLFHSKVLFGFRYLLLAR